MDWKPIPLCLTCLALYPGTIWISAPERSSLLGRPKKRAHIRNYSWKGIFRMGVFLLFLRGLCIEISLSLLARLAAPS